APPVPLGSRDLLQERRCEVIELAGQVAGFVLGQGAVAEADAVEQTGHSSRQVGEGSGCPMAQERLPCPGRELPRRLRWPGAQLEMLFEQPQQPGIEGHYDFPFPRYPFPAMPGHSEQARPLPQKQTGAENGQQPKGRTLPETAQQPQQELARFVLLFRVVVQDETLPQAYQGAAAFLPPLRQRKPGLDRSIVGRRRIEAEPVESQGVLIQHQRFDPAVGVTLAHYVDAVLLLLGSAEALDDARG